ncbi:MAG: hypothetical protein KBD66_02525 [Candidatus Doudnabacteria bacterium]|nr:hypothetical protein [Candidatus Doudnabacteria bacterium]
MWLTIFLFVILLVVLLGVWVGVSALIGVVRTRVPLVHSSSAHAAEVFRSLHFSHSTVFYELGSGNGRIVFLAERMGAGRIVGFELVTWAHALACLRTWYMRSRAEFRNEDFFQVSWAPATVVYSYLLPELLGDVERKFLAECAPGTVLVCKDFALPTLVPSRITSFEHPHRALMYVHP